MQVRGWQAAVTVSTWIWLVSCTASNVLMIYWQSSLLTRYALAVVAHENEGDATRYAIILDRSAMTKSVECENWPFCLL